MFSRNSMALLTMLLMFPQIVETIYSPALTDIALQFSVSTQEASQTLSVYFFGFAFGVLAWGRISDIYGRRPALLGGLLVYGTGSLTALLAKDFSVILIARVLAAFGAACGSVVTQTIFRDRFSGNALAKIFSFIGMALAISPAIGVYLGGVLASFGGYRMVFASLATLALVLLAWSCFTLEETRPAMTNSPPFTSVLHRTIKDGKLWQATILVTLFNVSLFSYYSLAPFMFQRLGQTPESFGYTGVILAAGSVVGAQINRLLLKSQRGSNAILPIALMMNIIGGTGVYLLANSLWFLAPMAIVMISYSMAIPVVLGSALSAYNDCRGTAGALFGLFYYLLIALGLGLSGVFQSLGLTLIINAIIIALIGWRYILRLRAENGGLGRGMTAHKK
ncbi:multidrug effflux MFS transporter [Yokenella regensburgei]|uniref:multidrug effflux MFS transporter n=1 Tax=Yokenella regensburgei TaxID=158877 RepID=UPI001376210E|nr:multidrug effflux MFS transporter [Yokenella regensburgei]KAF1366949.1 Bcr/CflA subfamily drug resistance transporter [Yokenella regensburgei]